ncbi:MAG TPA: DMT family transporter [Bauldia sp.]|nr:DMT family transporter [Bauldia sp.]
MAAPATPESLRGILLVVLSASVFAGVDGISKVLAETQSVGQIVWARYAIALPVVVLLTPRSEWRDLFRTRHPFHQILRGLTPIGVSVAMVLAVRYLPLAEATVILFAAPFLVVALAGPILGEHVHPSSWIGVVTGFAAVVIVARPGLGEISWYALFPLTAAIFYALYQLVTRGLANKRERPRTTLIWTLATGSVIATPLALFTWEPVSTEAWLLMLSLGLVFWLAQYLMIQAFAHAPAGVLAPFAYAQIVAATIVGMVFFDALPDVWTVIGVVMIIGAGIFLARQQRQ